LRASLAEAKNNYPPEVPPSNQNLIILVFMDASEKCGKKFISFVVIF
jgi:hypothetical protein